jgi:predicted nucleic acid-binding protein
VIVYVEANFILEVALGQTESQAAEAILGLAESGAIRLIIPAFALSEPFTTIRYRGTEREKISIALAQQERELGRSALHQQFAPQVRQIVTILTAVRKAQMDALEQTVERVLGVGTPATLDAATFRQARQYQAIYDLAPQDAVIYAVVLMDLRRQDLPEAKCFISRDKDFTDPGIKAELGRFNCRYINNFTDGLNYTHRNLNLPSADAE